jgi:hypothetical protein
MLNQSITIYAAWYMRDIIRLIGILNSTTVYLHDKITPDVTVYPVILVPL